MHRRFVFHLYQDFSTTSVGMIVTIFTEQVFDMTMENGIKMDTDSLIENIRKIIWL